VDEELLMLAVLKSLGPEDYYNRNSAPPRRRYPPLRFGERVLRNLLSLIPYPAPTLLSPVSNLDSQADVPSD
jgi:hypothetical protein